MAKKVVIFIAALIAVCVVAFALVVVFSFVGNPFAYVVSYLRASDYIAENYQDRDFSITGVGYNFKNGEYHVSVVGAEGVDQHFSIGFTHEGKMIDYYDDLVASGWNTARRIDDDYRNTVEAVLEGDLPFELDFGYGTLDFIYTTDEGELSEYPDHYIKVSELEIDGEYDVAQIGRNNGKLVIYALDEDVSVSRLSQILLDLRRVFDEAGVFFRVVDLVLDEPSVGVSDGRVEVMDFEYSDIYEDGLEERVEADYKAALEYYNSLEK